MENNTDSDHFKGIRTFREKLASGQPAIGVAATFNDPLVSDVCADALDFVWYDLEHVQLDPAVLNAHLLACRSKQTASIVRVGDVQASSIKPVLDAGAGGIVAAQVRSVQEVEQLVSNCIYPPQGQRGFGARVPTNFGRDNDDYINRANEMIFTSVMIETAEALEAIEQIVRVKRLDSIVIGPWDLSGAIDTLGDVTSKTVIAAIDRIIAAARETGVYVGMGMGANAQFATTMIPRGVDWVQVGNDYEYIINGIDATIASIRAANG